MGKLLRQVERELKKAKHCAIYGEELNRVWPDDGNQRESKIARFSEDHGFACGFIVTVYARFSIESLASAAKIVFRLFPMRRLERRSVEHSVQENQKARAMPVTWRTQIA